MTDLPESLLGLAQRFAAPKQLLPESRRARYLGQRPNTGQIWNASWDQSFALVLLTSPPDQERAVVAAVPLTTEPGLEDEAAVILSSAATGWPVDLTAWLGLRAELPVRVLSEAVDEVSPEVIESLRDGAGELADGVRAGRSSTGPLDPAESFRADLTDTVAMLSQAPGLPAGGANKGDLRDLGLKLRDVLAALGTSQAEAMNIVVGKKVPDPHEIARLVQARPDLTVDLVMSKVRPLPLKLAQEIDQPTWKAQILAAARRSHRDEFNTRQDIAYDTYATAARQDLNEDWAGRLRRYFEAHEGHGR